MLFDASAAFVSVCFRLVADAEPGILPRLLVPFARRDLTPDSVSVERRGEALHASLAMAAMPAEMVHLVAGNLRQVVGVTELVVERVGERGGGRAGEADLARAA